MIIESEKAVCDSFGSKTDDSDESKFIKYYTFFDKFIIFIRFCGKFLVVFLSFGMILFRRLYNNREQNNI